MSKLLSTKDAALYLGISMRRIQALITSNRLPAQKIGNTYVINEEDLKLVKVRINGRPRKTTN